MDSLADIEILHNVQTRQDLISIVINASRQSTTVDQFCFYYYYDYSIHESSFCQTIIFFIIVLISNGISSHVYWMRLRCCWTAGNNRQVPTMTINK
jgi:hypothetical protein